MSKFNFTAFAFAVPLLIAAFASNAASALESDLYNVGGSDHMHVEIVGRTSVKKVGLNAAAPVLEAGDVTVVCVPSEPGTWTGYDIWNAVTCSSVVTYVY